VPSTTSGASVCKLGAGGVLTDPNDDQRTLFYGHFYEDGEDVLTATQTPDPNRALRSTGRICAIAKYQGLGFTLCTGNAGSTHRQYLTSATFAADMATLSYLNLIYLFYSCTNLATINGLGNLSGVRRMRYTYGHACCPIAPFVTNEDYAPNVLHKRWTEHASPVETSSGPSGADVMERWGSAAAYYCQTD
jgi:hypothetical protein